MTYSIQDIDDKNKWRVVYNNILQSKKFNNQKEADDHILRLVSGRERIETLEDHRHRRFE